MTVSKEERTFLKTQKQIFVTDIVKKHPSVTSEVGSDTLRMELVPDIPVKTLNWFLRDENATFDNHFNFSANTTYSVTNSFFEPIMDSAKIYIKGEDLPTYL